MTDQEILKKILHYNPETGIFTRIMSTAPSVNAGDIAGHKHIKGYLTISFLNKPTLCHRLAWLYVYGEYPNGRIDHINHNKKDNRIENLRDATASENSRNMKMHKKNTSGITGVSFDKRNNNYHSYIYHKKRITLGCTKDFFEACCLRKSANNKYGYHANHGI